MLNDNKTYPCYKVMVLFLLLSNIHSHVKSQTNKNDTIEVATIIYNGDTMEAKQLPYVFTYYSLNAAQRQARAEWTRLRNAVYVTYPYAKRAGLVFNDVQAHLVNIKDPFERKKYIKSREKELRKEFTEPLTNLSIYQGKVLMKLINRETGNECYEIIKEFKGGALARLYQTVAFFFSTSLKQTYDAVNEDREIEKIVVEVQRMYGYRS